MLQSDTHYWGVCQALQRWPFNGRQIVLMSLHYSVLSFGVKRPSTQCWRLDHGSPYL